VASSPSDADLAVIRTRLDQAPTRDAARDLLGGLTLTTLIGLARYCDLWIRQTSRKQQIIDLIVRGTTGARLDPMP
jgi:hypothetical protein